MNALQIAGSAILGTAVGVLAHTQLSGNANATAAAKTTQGAIIGSAALGSVILSGVAALNMAGTGSIAGYGAIAIAAAGVTLLAGLATG